jgi:hypothetical protein
MATTLRPGQRTTAVADQYVLEALLPVVVVDVVAFLLEECPSQLAQSLHEARRGLSAVVRLEQLQWQIRHQAVIATQKIVLPWSHGLARAR